MTMLPNGNYERIVTPIQHECISKDYILICRLYSWKEGLRLEIEDGDPYEDGYNNEFIVKYCPFCGYNAS